MNASISNAAPTDPGRGSAPPTRVQATVAALGRIGLDRYHVLAALGLLAVFLLYRFHIGAYLINDDEEGYLYAAWRISAGQVPYRDFITPQLPVFLYPGALLIALFGRSTELLRTESAALAVLAGGFTYLAGRRLFGPLAGLTAIALLLLQSDIFRVARAFRPEASMLMLGTLAVYLVVRAERPVAAGAAASEGPNTAADRRGYMLASVCFGLATMAKLFGVLPWAAALAYVAFGALAGGRDRRRAAGDLFALGLPGLLLVGAVMGGFFMITRDTFNDVVEHHLRQGAKHTPQEVLEKGLGFYWDAVNWHMALLALLPAGLLAIRRLAPQRGRVLLWQLPTLLVFLVMSRTLYARHLIYVLPAVALIVGAAVSLAARQPWPERRFAWLLLGGLVASMAGPFLLDDLDGIDRPDPGTPLLGRMIDTLLPADAKILADYAGIAFYANRMTTKTAAGLSEGATESGQITGAMLSRELKADNVGMVLIDAFSQNGQLNDMDDYDAFKADVDRDYRPLGTFFRLEQKLALFLRKDIPTLGIEYGWAELLGVRLQTVQAGAGEDVVVTPIWGTHDPQHKRYTAFLHLVGSDGRTWAQGDNLLVNAIQRASEEWEPGEVAATPLQLTVEPGTPPGRYRVVLGLYDRDSGQRFSFVRKDGSRGDAYDAGQITVNAPARPPDARALDFGAAALPAGPPIASGPFRLLALELPSGVRAGQPLEVRTTWRADRAPGAGARLELALIGPGERAVGRTRVDAGVPGGAVNGSGAAAPAAAASTGWPSAAWRAGEVITVRSALLVDPAAPAVSATLRARWLGAAAQTNGAPAAADAAVPLGDAVPLGQVGIDALPPPVTALPSFARALDAQLGDHVALLGSEAPPTMTIRVGAPITFTLYWRTAAPLTTPYTVLVHLLDSAGTVVAQADGPPAAGDRPATSWRGGEVIADLHVLPLPGDLIPGPYRLMVGLYDASEPGFPRLPTALRGAPVPDGRVTVSAVTLVK